MTENSDIDPPASASGQEAAVDQVTGSVAFVAQRGGARCPDQLPGGRDYRCGSTSTPAAPTTNSWQERANMPVSSANPDINCGDIPTQYKPIRITGADYHGLDRDGDGWGCDA